MRQRGYSTVEYVIVILMIVSAVIAMSGFIKLAAGGRLKASADNLAGTLFSPEGGQVRLQNCRQGYDRPVGVGGMQSTVSDQSRDAVLLPDPADPGATLDRLPDCAFGDLDLDTPDEG